MLDALDARRGKEARIHKAALATPAPEQARAVEQLRRIGVNLNQALRRGDVPDAMLLREVLAAVDSVRASFGYWTRT